MKQSSPGKWVLPVIVLSQFSCTSLWFAGNAVMPDIARTFQVVPGFLAFLTSAVQLGFISGTLVFALLSLADRFSPSRVFLLSALLAGLCNLGMCFGGISAGWLLFFRMLTGFFLAGIYPVGMKIASDHYKEGLGRSLGFLVGALALGTGFPHLLKSMSGGLPWQYVLYATSGLSVSGGLSMFLLVPDGPYRRPGTGLKPGAFLQGFRNRSFRAAATAYFGHMWELYAFWAFVPVMLTAYKHHNPGAGLDVSLLSFLVIASGGIACMLSGLLSKYADAARIAAAALLVSGACCLISPLVLYGSTLPVLYAFLFCWGIAVVADSPLLSTLVARNAPEEARGSSLTIVNCIGFSITIASIQLINAWMSEETARYIYMILAAGPVLGLAALIMRDPE